MTGLDSLVPSPSPRLSPIKGEGEGVFCVALVLLLCLCVSACGFRPLYQNTSTLAGGRTVLDNIGIVSPNNTYTVQAVQNALIDRFYHQGTPQQTRYALSFQIIENTRNLVIQRNDTSTRAQLVSSANYQLTDTESKKVIDQGTIRAVSSYNILPSQYATLVSQNDARDRNVRELADKITTRMAVVLE